MGISGNGKVNQGVRKGMIPLEERGIWVVVVIILKVMDLQNNSPMCEICCIEI